MTSYGIWDGSSCTSCVEPNPDVDNGVSEDTPCEDCGWYRGLLSGERYPPGYNATSWRYATERIAELREEFPQFPKGMIAETVRRVGEDDMGGEKARDALTCTQAAKQMAEEFPNLSTDDVSWLVGAATKDDSNIMYDLDKVRELMTSLEKKREERTKRQEELGLNFDRKFDSPDSEVLIEVMQSINGCFYCHTEGAKARCTKCKVAVYCNRECQAASWKNKDVPHKEECKTYCENVAPMREGSDPGPVPVALACIGLISSDKILEMCMDKRTDAFLDEVARVGTDPVTLGISIAVIWNLDMARLQVSSRFIDGEMNIVDTNMIVMQTISENPHLQRTIHPLDGGPGDLPAGARRKVIFKLGEFFQKARDRNIDVSSMTCGRATLWLHNEQEWKDRLIAANDGGRMMIMPSTQYMFA